MRHCRLHSYYLPSTHCLFHTISYLAQNSCSKVTVISWALQPPLSPPFGQFIFPYFNLLDNKEQGVWGASYLNVGRGTIEMTVNCAPLSLHVVPSMPSPPLTPPQPHSMSALHPPLNTVNKLFLLTAAQNRATALLQAAARQKWV